MRAGLVIGVMVIAACSSSAAPEPETELEAGVPADDAAPRPLNDGGLPGDAGVDGSWSPPSTDLPSLVPLVAQLSAATLGLVVNTDDPHSVAVAASYIEKRKVPAANVVRLALGAPHKVVAAATFATWKAQVDAALPSSVQALAISFTQPSVVESCMSITAAFAFGYDAKYCVACGSGPYDPYYLTPTARPFTDLAMRPTMMLASSSIAEADQLIQRGIAADGTFPPGNGWFFRTTDATRSNPRIASFQATVAEFDPNVLALSYVDQPAGGPGELVGAKDVLIYETGRPRIPSIETNAYLPGAFADHLTSSGGSFQNTCAASGQMNVICWLEAGVTGSYGTVVEPCAYAEKFPDPRRLTEAYFRGATLVEAAWQSVAWPGQGIFVGEPLARPFGSRISRSGDHGVFESTELVANAVYALESANADSGPWSMVKDDITVAKPARFSADIALGPRFVRLRKK